MRTIASATNLDDAGAALCAAYSDVTVRLPASQQVHMRLTTLSVPGLTVGDLELTRSEVRTACFPWFAVCLPVLGRITVSTPRGGAVVTDRLGTIVNPGEQANVEYLSPRCRMKTVLIERAALEDELSAILGRPIGRPLEFDPAVESDGARPLGRSLALLASEFDEPDGLAGHPTTATHLGRLVAAATLTSCRHNYSAELDAPERGRRPDPRPRAIRRALEVIDAQADSITTVGELARAVGLSVRALDAGFHRHVGVPPMKHLRQVRLARVHHDLQHADPSTATTSALARRWGFTHYGRFAADYRRVYGCLPAQTLRSHDR